jgi:hypothetical protein
MGAFAAAVPYILEGATVAAGVYSAVQQRNAGIQQQFQYKEQAAQEGDAARQREIDRKRNLLRALASQNAAAGANGISFDGSAANLARVDIEQSNSDSLIDNVNSGRRGRVLQMGGREARRSGDLAAAGSLLDTVKKVA